MLAFPLPVSISGLDDEIIYRPKFTATFLSLDIFEFFSVIEPHHFRHLSFPQATLLIDPKSSLASKAN